MAQSGLQLIEGVPVLPLDGLWQSVAGVAPEDRLVEALSYAGCEFHDDDRRFVRAPAIGLVAIGGVPVASAGESEQRIGERLTEAVYGSRILMGSSANFSYLSDKTPEESYKMVTGLGHLSVAHTVQVSMLVAGISQATELELSLQRDLVHLSKLTNARTRVQDRPPLLVEDARDLPRIAALDSAVTSIAAELRSTGQRDRDRTELVNTLFPTRKATILMISGTLRNFGKLTDFVDDDGKEREFRELNSRLRKPLSILWPEIFTEGEA